MHELRRAAGENIRLLTSIVDAGAGVSGLSPVARIRRMSDGKFFNGSIATPADPFQVAVYSNPMVALDAANLPGVYYFDFAQSRDTLGLSEYAVRMVSLAGTLATEDVLLRTGPFVSVDARSECAIFGTILTALQEPMRNVKVKATAIPIATAAPAVGYSMDEVEASTDENGEFSLSVVQGLRIRLEIPSIGYDKRVLVPTAASVDFTTL